MIRREARLQEAIYLFVKRCVDCECEFASHDRSAARTPRQHLFEAKRGIRRSWPDTELCLPDGRTFRCELKAPHITKLDDEDQGRLLMRLSMLGHPSAWANSVTLYGKWLERFDVPLKGNWRTVAQMFDLSVAADIRKQELTKGKGKQMVGNIVKFRTKRSGRATAAQIRKAEAARRLP